ncbi:MULTISPECIES: hypothetical protein [Streptomyces]|uniref:Uncharacterized protein n=1 Tax=Streptomyces flaveolus TaxID=67297 RepID=A0ABV3AKS0_9ACTN|nr:hypothetical protein [Streptomyces sp. NRRL F-3307]
MVLEVECLFHQSDQLFERLVLSEASGEGTEVDQAVPADELSAADACEEFGAGDVDARVHERRADAFAESFNRSAVSAPVDVCGFSRWMSSISTSRTPAWARWYTRPR